MTNVERAQEIADRVYALMHQNGEPNISLPQEIATSVSALVTLGQLYAELARHDHEVGA